MVAFVPKEHLSAQLARRALLDDIMSQSKLITPLLFYFQVVTVLCPNVVLQMSLQTTLRHKSNRLMSNLQKLSRSEAENRQL